MDWRAFHAVNEFVWRHHWLGTVAKELERYGVVVFAVAAFALWAVDRPGSRRHWKLASAYGLASGALALLVNRIVSTLWHRERPYQAHAGVHVFGSRSTDPSFPSDHASAAFGIAFGVFLVDCVAGVLFLAAAVVIAAGRVLVGAHYPLDVLAGLLVGLGCAVLIVRFARRVIEALARIVERVTDPLLAPLWRLGARR